MNYRKALCQPRTDSARINRMKSAFLKFAALADCGRFRRRRALRANLAAYPAGRDLVPRRRTVSALRRAIPLALLISVFGRTADAQGKDDLSCEQSLPSWCGLSEEQADFLRHSQRASEKYHRFAAAVGDGFRAVGADAPAMGLHWVNIMWLFDGEIDAERPEILMYAKVNGRDSLVGIGFGYAVSPGTPVPATPFHTDDWHIHSDRLDMESHRTDHEGDGLHGAGSAVHGPGASTGISVLHGWVWIENPAGVLEPNNWTLPYIRLGLSRPEDATPEADRALSLATIGADFFITRAELFMDLGSGPAGGWAEALRRAEDEVKTWWRARPEGPLTSLEVEWLGRLWSRFELNGL